MLDSWIRGVCGGMMVAIGTAMGTVSGSDAMNPRRVIIYVSGVSSGSVTMAYGDTLRDVTARAYDNRGRYLPLTSVGWNGSTPGTVTVIPEPGTLGQRVKIVGDTANSLSYVIASSVIASQTVRDTLLVTVLAAPIPVDTVPAWQKAGCSLPIKTRLDSLVRIVSVSGTDTVVVDILAYFKVAAKQIVFHADTASWHHYKVDSMPQAGDTLAECPPHD